MRTHLYGLGTRVKIRRGTFPMNPQLVGREGLVVDRNWYRQGKYGVQLDDEDQVREFAEDELQPMAGDPRPESSLGSPGPTIKS